jgi:hypothetical protein
LKQQIGVVREECVMSVQADNRRFSGLRIGAARARPAVLTLALGFVVAVMVLGGYPPAPGGAAAAPLAQDPPTPTLAPGSGAILGLAWVDSDTDGIQDPGEAPLPNTVVRAENTATGAVYQGTSGADGKYRLNSLPPAIYRVTATPPAAYVLTTQATYNVAVASGALVALNFGAWPPPSPTPSPTAPPELDASNAERVYCGGVYSGDTRLAQNNVRAYGCVPWWDESGNERVYRLEITASQPVTVTLLTSSPDFDLFLLRYVYPDSCLAAGDTYLTHNAEPGVYFLAVDGYRGANGPYAFRVDCPLDERATSTPTLTPSATPTATPTGPITPTPTVTPGRSAPRLYLPLVVRTSRGLTGPSITLTLQDGLNGYAGTADSTLDSWTPLDRYGADNRLRIFYGRPPRLETQKSPVIKFDLSLIPAQAEVSNATLRLYLSSAPAYDLRVAAQGLLRGWDEAGATWNEAAAGMPWAGPGASAVGSDRTEWASGPQHIVAGERWYEFDVTTLAKEWARDPARNHGVVMTALAGDSDASVEARFTSREGDGRFRPQFVISYALPAVTAR